MNIVLNTFLGQKSLILPGLFWSHPLVYFSFTQELTLSLLFLRSRLAKFSTERGRDRGAINHRYTRVIKYWNFTVRYRFVKTWFLWSFSITNLQIYLLLSLNHHLSFPVSNSLLRWLQTWKNGRHTWGVLKMNGFPGRIQRYSDSVHLFYILSILNTKFIWIFIKDHFPHIIPFPHLLVVPLMPSSNDQVTYLL